MCIIAILALLFTTVLECAEKKMLYTSESKGSKTQHCWVLDQQKTMWHISTQKQGRDIAMHFSPDFLLLEYQEQQGSNRKLHIAKRGNKLEIICSETEKNTTKKSYDIKNKPWIQEFAFGLEAFILGDKTSYHFCIVHPKDLSLHDMVITKESVEDKIIANITYQTCKTKIHLSGWKKKFWKGEAWFDQKTGALVQYKANEGPGTSETCTSLQQMDQSDPRPVAVP